MGDEMGLGKTLQVVALFTSLQAAASGGACLVIAPATVLRQWHREFRRWAPQIEHVVVLHASDSGGDAASRNSAVRRVCEGRATAGGRSSVLVTSYGMLRAHASHLLSQQWQYVVLDEGHKIRNPDAEVTLICKRFHTPHRLILTGAPIQNKLTELWSLFDFVYPGKLGFARLARCASLSLYLPCTSPAPPLQDAAYFRGAVFHPDRRGLVRQRLRLQGAGRVPVLGSTA